MSIVAVLSAVTLTSFGGLENTVKMNEYTLTLEQNIQNVQRASMLLERNSNENWIYGIGIDFGSMGNSGKYTVFKWCSPFANYGDIRTKSILPNYDPTPSLGGVGASIPGTQDVNGDIPNRTTIPASTTCPGNTANSDLRTLLGYTTSVETPESVISIAKINNQQPRFVLFESVSGRAFFYDTTGALINYKTDGTLVSTNPFVITINPTGAGSTRIISISNLSGKVSTSIGQ
jgi:type II secretory pathway pseudopilin PulG